MTDAVLADIEAIRDRMIRIEHEAQRALAAQQMAAGDDTHYFRASLVEFCMWSHGCDNVRATEHVNDYLDEQKGRYFPRRFMRRKRKV